MKKQLEIWTIPNILSFFRLALIPFIVWAYFLEVHLLCAGLIVLSGITDILDGYIARRFDMVSALGKALDPIADKLTLFAILIFVGIEKNILLVLLGIFIVKEILMGIEGLIIIKKTGTTYSAEWYGKITTLVMYLSMITVIVWQNIPQIAIHIILILCSALVLFSFIMYSIRNYKNLKNSSKNEQ